MSGMTTMDFLAKHEKELQEMERDLIVINRHLRIQLKARGLKPVTDTDGEVTAWV